MEPFTRWQAIAAPIDERNLDTNQLCPTRFNKVALADPDYQRILFGSVDVLSNPGPSAAELSGMITRDRLLGASNGIGFGWNDQSVFKLGANYRYNADAVDLYRRKVLRQVRRAEAEGKTG